MNISDIFILATGYIPKNFRLRRAFPIHPELYLARVWSSGLRGLAVRKDTKPICQDLVFWRLSGVKQ